MTGTAKTKNELLTEVEALRLRLEEAEETLRAIGSGAVDAFVVTSPEGEQQVFTLKGAEQPYRILVETMGEGAATLTADGTILYCNSRLAAMLQVPQERLVGKQLGSYVAPANLPLLFSLLNECTKEQAKAEMIMCTGTGNTVPVFFSCCAHDLSGNSGIGVVITDLTQQKRNEIIAASEAALRQSEERYRGVVENTTAVILRVTPDGIIRFANGRALEFFGYSAEELIGKHAVGTIVPERETTGRNLAAMVEAIATDPDRFHTNANENLRKNGERVWLEWTNSGVYDASGKLQEFLSVGIDATERKRAVEALRDAEREKSLILDNANELIAFHDCANNLIWANKAYLASTNIPLADLKGRKCFSCWGLDHICDRCPVVIAVRTGQPQEAELTPQNQPHWPAEQGSWLVRAAPVRDDAGNIVGAIEVAHDITTRKQAEEALILKNAELETAQKLAEDKRRRLAAVMEALPIGIAITDALGGTIQSNRAFELVWGESLPEARSVEDYTAYKAWWADTGKPVAPEEWASALAVRTGVTVTGQVMKIQRFDGSIAFVINSASPVRDADGSIVGCVVAIQDISELKRVEESLRASEERHRVLAETMLQGVVHQDASGTIISMNPAAERILGKNREDFLGLNSIDTEHDTIRENGEAFPGMEHPTMVALRTELPVRGVVMGVFNPKLQEHRWISIDALPVFRPGEDHPSEVYSVFEDITDRKKAEKALQASEQRIQQALHVSRSFTFDWQPGTDQVQRSASCAEILKLAGNEAVNDTGEHFLHCVHPDDQVRFRQTLGDLTPASDSYVTEYRYVSKDGSEITLEETGRASFDDSGRMQRLVGVSTDITLRKKAELALKIAYNELELRVAERTRELADSISHLQNEIRERELAEESLRKETAERVQAIEALREKEQMLIQQSRQAAMGEMLGNIAHQWRQPLNTLGLYTQRLGVFYGMPDFNKEFLDSSIAKSMEIIKHMSKTIDDFRDFFNPEKGKTDFYVIEAVKSTLSLLEGNFQSPKISIDFVAHDNPVITGYQNEFAQVLLNILNNARDALIERDIADGRIIITICLDGNCAVVTVTDNAGGIPDEIINKVFDPYFTTKGPQVGTGIGLFMSKTIIEKNLGGRLTVRNTGTGAEFRIEVKHGTQN